MGHASRVIVVTSGSGTAESPSSADARVLFNKKQLPVLLLSVLLSVQACVPVYSYHDRVAAGQKVTSEQATFINPGITTRDEVISKLGKPAVDLRDLRILMYPWTELKSQWVGVVPGFIWTAPLTASWVLFVATDENGRVTHFGFQELKGSMSTPTVISEARDWAEAEQVALPSASTSFSPMAIPEGKAILYVYRIDQPLPRFAFPSESPVAVAIDGQYVTELRRETYAAFAISPGAHEIIADPSPSYRFTLRLPSAPRGSPTTINLLAAQRQQQFVHLLSVHQIHFTKETIDTALTVTNGPDAESVLNTLRPAW